MLSDENSILTNSTTENSFSEEDELISKQNSNKIHSKKKFTALDYLEKINKVLTDLIEESEKNNNNKKDGLYIKSSLYCLSRLPNITLIDYLKRIYEYLNPEKSTILLSLIYVDDFFSNKNINLYMKYNNIFKVFLIAILIAIKMTNDIHDTNVIFAKVGGISLEECNLLEAEFCIAMKFNFYVNDEIFNEYKIFLENF